MSTRLLWPHKPAVLATIPRDLRRRPVRCDPLPDVLEASTVDDCAPAYASQDTTYPGCPELASSSEPPDQSADVNTRAHRARYYPRDSESSDMNDVDTRPITVAANLKLVRCLPDCCGHTSPPCSLPFPGTYDAILSAATMTPRQLASQPATALEVTEVDLSQTRPLQPLPYYCS